jgi:hypothetical protein
LAGAVVAHLLELVSRSRRSDNRAVAFHGATRSAVRFERAAAAFSVAGFGERSNAAHDGNDTSSLEGVFSSTIQNAPLL